MLISENELKESADLAIAYWKKQIVLCPNINDNNKEWGKEFIETMVKKELGKLKMKLEEVVAGQYGLRRKCGSRKKLKSHTNY